jgi:3-dehydroquinate dehydratase / shikimate dehydrogenase
MNNGKICVSICAATTDALIKQMKLAENLADVIEIRFDCLSSKEFNLLDLENSNRVLSKILNKQNIKKEIILTFRSKEQGGNRDISQEERGIFWNGGFDRDWADFEEDVLEDSYSWLWEKRICSYHDFHGVPENLIEIYRRIKSRDLVDVIKIAVKADDITDTIAIWKLLEQWKSEQDSIKAKRLKKLEELEKKINFPFAQPNSFLQIIPIAMGEAGRWTRILGLAHGAFMTYTALGTGKETAEGQITAEDAIETYRVKELDEQTEIYGIIGNPVSHSLSPYIHNAAFKHHKINAVYIPFQVKNLDDFIAKFVREETREIKLNFKGFSVTIPHKQAIIKHLDSIDEIAGKIGAVNTVKIINGKLHGYNTDAQGFIEPLKSVYGDLKKAKVAVFGSGGAARACIYALKNEGSNVIVYARDLKKAQNLLTDFQIELEEFSSQNLKLETIDILINATPLGTAGDFENETPVLAEQVKNVRLVYDLVYNPTGTRFLREAKSVDVPTVGGLAMLISQAAAQFKIWTEQDAPKEEMSFAALRKLHS